MDMTKDYAIKERLCKEKDAIAEKLMAGQDMSIQDLDKLDKIYHTLKNLCKYIEYQEDPEYERGGLSGEGPSSGYYRGRSMNSAYAKGYSEAMNQMRRDPYYEHPPRW